MRIQTALSALVIMTCSVIATSAAAKGNVIDDILLHFAPGFGTDWIYVSSPPAHILEEALSSQARIEERLLKNAPELLEKELQADFRSVVSFYDEATDMYRIVWYYRWSSECEENSYKFNFVTYPGSENTAAANIPLTGSGRHEAECQLDGQLSEAERAADFSG